MAKSIVDCAEEARVDYGAKKPHDTVRPARSAYLDVKGLAEMLGVAECFVRRLVWERRIPYYKVGKYVRFDVTEVLEHLASWRIDPLR